MSAVRATDVATRTPPAIFVTLASTPKGAADVGWIAESPEWSEWDERHGRWAGIATREECLAVERCGRSRDTKKKLYDLQSKKNQSIHFMPSLIRKLFHKSEAPNDGLTQPQREAIVDLLNYCMYADNLIFLAEDRLITDTVAKFNWDPKLPFDQFDVRSIDNARNARENQGYRDRFLASIRDRLEYRCSEGTSIGPVPGALCRRWRAL